MNIIIASRRAASRAAVAWLLVGALWWAPRPCVSQDFNLVTDYQNPWFVPGPPGGPYANYFGTNAASTTVFGGSVLDNSRTATASLPTDGRFGLASSSLGQPVVSILSDVAIGSVIEPPPGFGAALPPANFVPVRVGDNLAAYYAPPEGGAFYSPSTGRVIASQPNNLEIVWTNALGLSRRQVINVSPVPTRRPSKLFWTESPYDAPVVSLGGLFPAIHYNSEAQPPEFEIITTTNGAVVTTTTNVVRGVWLDSQKQLHAKGVTGTFLIEFYRDGTYTQQVQPLGVEIVHVLPPEVQLIEAGMGERLLPLDSYWGNADGISGVIPDVSRSATDAVLVVGQEGPKKNWAFPLRRTWMDPWSLEIYWKQTGLMGVQWPYEVDWYSVDWPAHPQVFVIGDNGGADQAPALIANELTASILPDMDPPLHASLSPSGKAFMAVEPGFSMVQYSTPTNIWFEVIQSVSHTNAIYFDLQPVAAVIGEELTPGDERAHALWLDADGDYVSVADAFVNKLEQWTVSFWLSPDLARESTVYSEGDESSAAISIGFVDNGRLRVAVNHQGATTTFTTTTNRAVKANVWQHVAVTYNDVDGGGLLSVYLDGAVESRTGIPRVLFDAEDRTILGARSANPLSQFFRGKLDVRVWSVALTASQISSNRFTLTSDAQDGLIGWFPCNEGQGNVLDNHAGDKKGTLYGDGAWTYGQFVPDEGWDGYPGYIHTAQGTRYHPGHYNYPTEADLTTESRIFAVNAGELEVWWANRSRNQDMPPVYYPSRVVRYTNSWPANASQIFIASGLGSDGAQPPGAPAWDPYQALSPSIYYQNEADLDGYNPNEEHALLLDGVVYALRNDLNQEDSSEPYVLVDYTDATTGLPRMRVFHVAATNEWYQFERDMTAGQPIVPILPLGAFPPALRTASDNTPPAWQDRKLEWWAVAAGNDGAAADASMRFYYAMQPGFYFPALAPENQPPAGTEVPWLAGPDPDDAEDGLPIPFVYHVAWPDDVPKLRLGQTLTLPANGLPDVWNQLSVEVPYQQSHHQTASESVLLFDPLEAHGAPLDGAVIDALTSAQIARVDIASGLVRFPGLPPSLYPRLYYDRASGKLVLEGKRVETLTGAGFLLLNLLEPFEAAQSRAAALGIDASLKSQWDAAVDQLPTSLTPIDPNAPYVKAALAARLSEGAGYVTLAFNNSANTHQVPAALPVSLSVIRVDTNLYAGELEVIQPEDVLAEQLSLRVSPDFAGLAGQCEFRWRWADPVGGLPPQSPFEGWNLYGLDPTQGANEVTIAGASPFTLSDHFFAVQYRPINTNGPSGDTWSDWTYNLAPGWVVRAMTGINPFMQTFRDMLNNAPDTRVTMMSQAGGPYEGDIALNLAAASEAGLIPTYETIFRRAKTFSLEVGFADDQINQTLLFAASRLHDLYSLLGNEAFADAQDPTVGYAQPLADSGNFLGAHGTSLFPFMNQVPNALEEELALLRGRDDTLLPSVTTSPVYNRLIWNFTQAINGGEAAYASIYNVVGNPDSASGVITADDAKRLYPQGHGDAWGHYLSAIRPYYDLLAHSIFNWNTEPGATLVGNASVTTDFLDEQKFAETAAARARTGAQIVQSTFRKLYSEDPETRWAGYHDSNTNRAWGIADWASRAGQAAYYDWAVANSLLVTTLTNLTQLNPIAESRPPEGIERIDRNSMPELFEIASQFDLIQAQADNVNGGLNPLGFARNAVPFDIDPSAVDAGETHFEQIYNRAEQAVLNAAVAFDNARQASAQLRQQFDSVHELAETLSANETDYHNRLIEIFGYPYPDDIGPTGTYPQGYDGPDLINWQIVDVENLVANAPTNTQTLEVEIYDLGFTVNKDFETKQYNDYDNIKGVRSEEEIATIQITINSDGLQVKPPGWTGRRRAQGELQLAISDYIQAWYGMEAAMEEYEIMMEELEDDIEHRLSDYERIPDEWKSSIRNIESKRVSLGIIKGFEIDASSIEVLALAYKEFSFNNAHLLPNETEGIIGPYPVLEIHDAQLRATARNVASRASFAQFIAAQTSEFASMSREIVQEKDDLSLEQLLKNYEYQGELRWETAETQIKLRNQYVKLAELQAGVAAFEQSFQRIQKLLAEGQKLFFERGQVRSRAAQRIQSSRYDDLAFRIYRNDALRRYQSTFNLAARYVYLAAKAYDYETGLLSSEATLTPGRRFLEDVARARTPGRFSSWLGTPLPATAGSGDPGLADILARMKADWEVIKGRFGFNNPENETSRFSLRTELFRASPDAAGDAAWAQTLENCLVADLNQLTEYRRYCRPFSASTNPEPGIVIRFPSYVMAGKSFFGMDLAGGDNAYDPSHAATKIRSAGVWFTGYNTASGGGSSLANAPRVYLVPVGVDILRSPTGGADQTRSFNVFDQAIPLPYDISNANMDRPDWSPITDSLQESFGQSRKFASFRAYHDSGDFDPAETITSGRLVGRSVWNTDWMLIIPGRTLLNDPDEGLQRFIYGGLAGDQRDGNSVKDIKISFQTYSISGN
jgi:hypothetical protein